MCHDFEVFLEHFCQVLWPSKLSLSKYSTLSLWHCHFPVLSSSFFTFNSGKTILTFDNFKLKSNWQSIQNNYHTNFPFKKWSRMLTNWFYSKNDRFIVFQKMKNVTFGSQNFAFWRRPKMDQFFIFWLNQFVSFLFVKHYCITYLPV